jgi:response regulator RpfG family c-di-GMP phosphodiesterase
MLLQQIDFADETAFDSADFDTTVTRRPGVLMVAPASNEREKMACELTREGFDVWTAANENDAFRTFLFHAIDLDVLLIDATTLGMSAWVLARRVKHVAPNVGCVFLVSHATFALSDPLIAADALVAKSAETREIVNYLWESLALGSWIGGEQWIG